MSSAAGARPSVTGTRQYVTRWPSARSARYTSAGVCTAPGLDTGSHVSTSSPVPPPLMADSRATRMRPP
jgi:hypothetical protein